MDNRGVVNTDKHVIGLKETFLLVFLALAISACSVDASLLGQSESSTNPSTEKSSRSSPDFIAAEVVTTSLGYQVRAVFGETSEKVSLPNGYQIEGVFYE